MRTLRSKHERNRLYIAADGKCQICGNSLDDDWQVDHIIPYSIVQKTEISNLQVVCKRCNLKKGNKMLRKHQVELINLINKLILKYKETGELPKNPIVIEAFPGSGKSSHPVIALKLLKDAGIIDKLCWVVPRISLKNQGAEEFLKPYLKQDFPHSLEIRETETVNDMNPTHGSDGYVTTYQAILSAKQNNVNSKNAHQYEFQQHDYVLFLDECQHIVKDRKDQKGYSYFKAIQPLVESAKLVICASGTLYRHEEEQIAFIQYDDVIENGINYKEPKIDIRYTYDDARKDCAVIPLYFDSGIPSKIKYTRNGEEIEKNQFETNTDLSVALDTEYADQLLDHGLKEWQEYKYSVNNRSKLIIIGNDQKNCRHYYKTLQERGINSCLAISDEGKQAQKAIDLFRKDTRHNILITCQMAYEGLDCKAATHLIVLTKIRSIPWLIQMFTRVMRYDKDCKLSYEEQHAFAIVPNDEAMKTALEKLNAKEKIILGEDTETSFLDDLVKDGSAKNSAIVIENRESALGEVYQSNLQGDQVPSTLSPKIRIWKNRNQLQALPDISIYKMLRDNGILHVLDSIYSTDQNIEILETPKTIKEKENEARKKIETFSRKLDYYLKLPCGTWNKKVFNHFRQNARRNMSLEQLETAYNWMIQEAKKEAAKKEAAKKI